MPSIYHRTTSGHIQTRSGHSRKPGAGYIVGFCVMGILVVGLVTWTTVRYFRKRTSAKCPSALKSSLSVRSLVKEVPDEKEKELPE